MCHAQIKEFLSGGSKPDLTMCLFFWSLTYFTVYYFITEKTILFEGFRGGPTFSRGVQLFPGEGGGGGGACPNANF